MRTIAFVFMSLLMLVGGGCQSSPRADVYVSPAGDDQAAGTLTDAFRTPQRALAVAGDMAAERTGAEPIVIMLRGGTYDLPDGLTIDAATTGGRPLIIRSYPGEIATLVGGKPVTNWQRETQNIHRARIDLPESANQVFVDGHRAELARHPNRGYLQVAWTNRQVELGDDYFYYRGGDVRSEDAPDKPDPASWDLSGAKVVVWPRIDWFSFERDITAIDTDKRLIELDEAVRYTIGRNNRYYFKNIRQLLDVPGEAHLDVADGVVRLWPRGDNPRQQTVHVATAPTLVRVAGESAERPVTDVALIDLNLSIAAGSAVAITNAADIRIVGCRIENAGEHGVAVTGAAERVTIANNEIRQVGYHGVHLVGEEPTADAAPHNDVNHSHVVHNNHIHHVGRLVGHAAGVQIRQSGRNRITHNRIHHSPRYGINVTGQRYQLLREENPKVTFANRHQFLHARENLIAFNHIHHVVLDSADAGGVAAWGAGRDNRVHQNLIHNVGNARSYNTHGIFLDDGVDHWQVTKNTVWGLIGRETANEAAFIKGIGHTIENNVFIVDQNTDSGIASDYYVKTGEVTRDLTFLRNIIHIETDRGAAMHFWNWGEDRVKRSDYNLFHAPHGEVTVLGGPFDHRFDLWRQRFDQHSLVADPKFVDAHRRDYRLRPDSPAWQLGFEPIDYERIGLTEAFPQRLR
jgi:hypothetical protein